MKVSLEWLKDYLDISLSRRELEELFSEMGFPAEEVVSYSDDLIFDLEVTPNRPDCLSHYGIAREMAVFLNLPLKLPEFPLEEADEKAEFDIKIEAPDLCPVYVARVVEGVEVKESPDWLKERLEKIGVQSINSVVDLSNYVLFAFGHPTHVFDMDRLEGGLKIRRGRGEKILCLDEVEREVTEQDLVIADFQKPVAIAGVIGGEDTGVTFSTKRVLIESAYFKPESVRKTAKRLGISTDASYRFERGADPMAPEKMADILAYLISRYSGGRVLRGRLVQGSFKDDRKIFTTIEFLNQRLGTEVQEEFVVGKLEKMGCTVKVQEGRLEITPPSWRRDLEIAEDIVEEIARLKGYEKFPSELPSFSLPQGLRTPLRELRWELRQKLAGLGYMEAMTYIFTSEEKDRFSGGKGKPLSLSNPLSKEEPLLRRSVLLTLLDSLSLNLRMGNRGAALFELGRVYWEEKEPMEEERLAIVEAGILQEKPWLGPQVEASFYSLKGALEALFAHFGVKGKFEEASHPMFEEGYTLKYGNAWLGVVREELTQKYDIEQTVFAAEIPLEMFMKGRREEFRDVIKLPSIKRDVSLIFPASVRFADIKEVVESQRLPILYRFSIMDLYRGKGIGEDEKSLTLSFVFRSEERTLRSEEVEQALEGIINILEKKFGARRRGV